MHESGQQFPLPRVAVPWLLGTQWLALLLHVSHMPLWLWGLALLVSGWRWLTHLGRLSYPNRWVKTLAVLMACAAVVVAFDRKLTLESAAAFLIAASLLKLLEMKVRRDGYVVAFLGLFLLATGFLFEQAIASALFGVVAVWLLVSTLVTLHFPAGGGEPGQYPRAMKTAAQVLLLSLPMMLVLYLLFPRFGPLWSFTLQSGKTSTGLADEMRPGDIAELSQSDALAFRASFLTGELPAREQLYWRALVLDHYDGRRWLRRRGEVVRWVEPGTRPAPQADIEYEIIQEPTGKNWLFALPGAMARELRTGLTDDQRLVARRPVFQRQRYRAAADLDTPPADLMDGNRPYWLQLPAGFNPRAQQLARQWALEERSPAAVVQRIMTHFRDSGFAYTLKPQRLGQDEIDEFLFDQQRGFCAHYAGAMVFLARAAGIPARVVTGYQGGEWNAKERYLSVRQFDAHAWVEVWLAGAGWVRYDPTAMVAADRIRYGLERAVAAEGTFLQEQTFSAHRLKGIGWLNRLRLEMDSLNYYWQRWVLAYDDERQQSFLKGLLGLRDYQQGLYLIAASFALFFVVAGVWLWWRLRPQRQSAFMRQWQRLQARGERLGVAACTGETAAAYCQRLAEACPPQRARLLWLGREINRVLYQPLADASAQQRRERQLLREIGRVRRQLPRGQAQKQPLPATLTKGP